MMKNVKIILFLFGIIGITTFSCENKETNVEGNIIGYDPCSVSYNIGEGRGFIITIDKTSDTLLTYNLPGGLFLFPQERFQTENSTHQYLFPDSIRDKYAIRFTYKYSTEDEKIFLCRWDIFIDEFGEKFKNKQVIVKSVTANK